MAFCRTLICRNSSGVPKLPFEAWLVALGLESPRIYSNMIADIRNSLFGDDKVVISLVALRSTNEFPNFTSLRKHTVYEFPFQELPDLVHNISLCVSEG